MLNELSSRSNFQYGVYDRKTMEKYGIPIIMAEFGRSYLPNRVKITIGSLSFMIYHSRGQSKVWSMILWKFRIDTEQCKPWERIGPYSYRLWLGMITGMVVLEMVLLSQALFIKSSSENYTGEICKKQWGFKVFIPHSCQCSSCEMYLLLFKDEFIIIPFN